MTITPNILEETARGIQSYAIEDMMLKNREIFLTSAINDQSAVDTIKQLMYLDHKSADPVTIYINSPGGSVISGMAIYDYIRLMRSPVTTVCVGTAASMGAILFLSGSRRMMLPHSKVMIHDPYFGGTAMAGQKPLELKEKLNDLMETRKMLAEVIVEQTGMSKRQVLNFTKKDTFFDAKEALKVGIATEILGESPKSPSSGEGDGFRPAGKEEIPF